MLGTEPGSFIKAVSTLNDGAISLAPKKGMFSRTLNRAAKVAFFPNGKLEKFSIKCAKQKGKDICLGRKLWHSTKELTL